MKSASCLLGLFLLSFGGAALAQQQPTCPTLPPTAGLEWKQLAGADYLSCKATTTDGREVLGVMLTTRDPGLSLPRDHREEKGQILEEDFYWYRPDLGGREVGNRRIAVVPLGKKRYAQISIFAGDGQELGSLQTLAQRLDLVPASLALSR